MCRYHQHSVDKIVIVTNKNCSACFMKKSWDDNVKEKEKKVLFTPCVSSPFVPAKKHKPTSKIYPTISPSLSLVFKQQVYCLPGVTGVTGVTKG